MKKLVVVLCGLFLATFAIAQEEHGGTPVGEEHAGQPVGQEKAEEQAGQPVGKDAAIKKGKGKKKGLYKEHKKHKPQRHPKAHKRGKSKKLKE